jgi:AcrR family transcriptional regulator
VVALATELFMCGERIDLQALSAQLGVARATVYRWFGSRQGLIAEAVLAAARPTLRQARAQAQGSGAELLLDTFDRFNRSLAASAALRRFVETEREVALRVLTSGAQRVQPAIVEMIRELIDEQVSAGAFCPATESGTLAFAIVKLAEAFLYNDAVAGLRGDVERLRDVEALLLGLGRPAPATP